MLFQVAAPTDVNGNLVERYAYDPWGARRNPTDWTQKDSRTAWITNRGYTGHEHLDAFGIINMNGRVYDPYTAQFFSPDPYVQAPGDWLNYNRYGYCMGNPFKYTDPSGEFFWIPILIGAAIFGTGNLVAHAIKGDVNNFWDGLKYFGQGALVGAALGAAWQFAPLIPWAGQAIQTGMTWYAYGQVGLGVLGTITGAFNDGWKGVGNGAKTFLGNFYLDENSFFGGIGQGISRHTWESLQSLVGQGYTQIRNTFGAVDRVDYLGGATFATNENSDHWNGITFGNYINTNIWGEIYGNFADYVTTVDPMYMHEYGHTIDSRIFGLSYLFAVGLPSVSSASKSQQAKNEPSGVSTHNFYWSEMRANRNAKDYFNKYYNVDWDSQYNPYGFYSRTTIETFYPTKKR